MSGKGLVLVSGANGFVASRAIEALIQAGYNVRGTVRSRHSAGDLVKALSAHSSQLEIVEVPDITTPSAFDNAVKGVTAVAHLAAPVSLSFDDPEPVIKAAVEGTRAILESATKEKGIKSFVLMSSIASVSVGPKEEYYTYTEKDWNNTAEAMVTKLGKKTPGPLIYVASKVASEKAFWKFRDEQKPGFTMSTINPCFVGGPPLITPATSDKIPATTKHVWKILAGQDIATAGLGAYDGYVDVRDVARIITSIIKNPAVVDGERFIAASGYGPAQAVADILREAYPDRRRIIQEGNPKEGYLPGYKFPPKVVYDGSKAARTFGFEYIPIDKMVLDSAKVFESFL